MQSECVIAIYMMNLNNITPAKQPNDLPGVNSKPVSM